MPILMGLPGSSAHGLAQYMAQIPSARADAAACDDDTGGANSATK